MNGHFSNRNNLDSNSNARDETDLSQESGSSSKLEQITEERFEPRHFHRWAWQYKAISTDIQM
jgi:hypothetical protein